jgi:hypothetical protein
MKTYEWAVIGGGASGIAISEILTREGHSVVLIEKNKKLAAETTREFHEWIHTGSLYTLLPDDMSTLKFVLGSIDDLLEYYSSFERMNLIPTMKGLKINPREDGWFYTNYINFKFRISGRKVAVPWLFIVGRSLKLLKNIHEHDWLRRRGGVLDVFKKDLWKGLLRNVLILLKYHGKFFKVETSDFTTNSRHLLRDILATAIKNSLEISTDNAVINIEKNGGVTEVKGEKESFRVKNVAICAGAEVKNYFDVSIKTSYAPIAIAGGFDRDTNSFVELDYLQKKCINLITKKNGIGMIGGISFNKLNDCEPYFEYIIEEHKKYNPNIKILEKYIGKKNEITFKGEDRNYLYHVIQHEDKTNVWALIPGKFTLVFSMAPEFYRRVYQRNPRKNFIASMDNGDHKDLVANTVWHDTYNKHFNSKENQWE